MFELLPSPPPSLCYFAITAIASNETSPALFPCNKFILNTVATAKNPVATAKIIFFFILINLIISNCRPYYQHSVSFNAWLPSRDIEVKELSLFTHVSSKSLSLRYYYYLLSFWKGAGRGSVSLEALRLPLLFPMLLTTLLYLKFFSSLSLFLLLRKIPPLPDRHWNATSVRLRAIRSMPVWALWRNGSSFSSFSRRT